MPIAAEGKIITPENNLSVVNLNQAIFVGIVHNGIGLTREPS